MSRRALIVLVTDDDEDDRILVREAFEETGLDVDVRFVAGGSELLAYLRRQPPYDDPPLSPRPGLILLDLNMPGMDGRDVLRAIKADAALRALPVVVVTTSRDRDDVLECYRLGAAAYFAKPARFDALVDLLGTVGRYWITLTPGR